MMTNQLPDFLKNRQSRTIGERALSGLGGVLPPHISIRGNQFALIDASGNRQPLLVQTQQGQQIPSPILDCCIADISDVTCKMFFGKEWEPGADDPPVCWSMNGIGPSREVMDPQADTCELCPNNVRNSAVSKLSGKGIKACRDEKQMAVILAGRLDMIFRFTLTPGSFKNWRAYQQKFEGSGVDVSDIVTRIAFEQGKNGVLTFEAVSYIDEATFNAREQAIVSKATDVLVGRNDRPIDALPAPQPSQQFPAPQPSQQFPAPQPSQQFPAPQPSQQFPQVPFAAPSVASPSTGFATPPAAPPSVASAPPPAERRKRRTRAEMEAERAAQQQSAQPQQVVAPFRQPTAPAQQAPQLFTPGQGQQFAPPQPMQMNPPPNSGQDARFGIAQTTPVPDPELSATLDKLFPQGGQK